MEKQVALPLVELEDENQLKAVKKLNQVVDLTFICGYLTLINSPVEKTPEIHDGQQITASGDNIRIHSIESCNQIQETEKHGTHKQEWEIFSLDFGIPLFDQELNSQIFRGLNQNALLSEEK
ncbi:hypothetical protein QYM36_001005 [Artemia franciscana]|uniref:FAM91 C-terminal domain-containing protein n=2 Tax=Artemia franciscana TaxID=6661 RepID=A0AA88LBJ3_ARTSF|nr:hypothetical protein QYM36_001005 [Artemia franciscana]